jgi:tetratricopeptide (TPR) repeat protein
MKLNMKKYFILKFPFLKKRKHEEGDEIKWNYSSEIQALRDIEEVENDPMFQTTADTAKRIINDFNFKSEKNTKNREFIAETLKGDRASVDKVEKHSIYRGARNKISRKVVMTGLSIAAFLTVFFLIKSLLPGNNSEEIFSEYYKPFDAVTPVSRNSNSNLNLMFTEGISFYKSGEYQSAIKRFNDVIARDSALIAPVYFAGLTQIELGNFTDAAFFLSKVSARSSEFKYEAKWYLGLSYLKTGDISNAISCFEFLSVNSEFYMERARKILRSLKK